jgi:hypothetical protein
MEARQHALTPSFLPINVLVNLIAVNQIDPYNPDSSDGDSEFPSQSPIPSPPPSTIPIMRRKGDFPTLFRHALDTLSCPAMSTGCERAFSSVKKLITSERNHLGEDIIRPANA